MQDAACSMGRTAVNIVPGKWAEALVLPATSINKQNNTNPLNVQRILVPFEDEE